MVDHRLDRFALELRDIAQCVRRPARSCLRSEVERLRCCSGRSATRFYIPASAPPGNRECPPSGRSRNWERPCSDDARLIIRLLEIPLTVWFKLLRAAAVDRIVKLGRVGFLLQMDIDRAWNIRRSGAAYPARFHQIFGAIPYRRPGRRPGSGRRNSGSGSPCRPAGNRSARRGRRSAIPRAAF